MSSLQVSGTDAMARTLCSMLRRLESILLQCKSCNTSPRASVSTKRLIVCRLTEVDTHAGVQRFV